MFICKLRNLNDFILKSSLLTPIGIASSMSAIYQMNFVTEMNKKTLIVLEIAIPIKTWSLTSEVLHKGKQVFRINWVDLTTLRSVVVCLCVG